MSLNEKIKQAEDKWQNKLYNYCQQLFNNVKIPSHDHTHHLRVWEYSKDILKALNNKTEITYKLVEASIITSMFHDTGLTITLKENHGTESKKICLQYFEANKLPKPEYFEEILFAIENHDDKDYRLNDIKPESILSILCNADDLDAFGNIGVIRYTEIYLLRGISMNELPKKVIQNLDKRFINFEKTYKSFPELYNKHKERYSITKEFFNNLLNETI